MKYVNCPKCEWTLGVPEKLIGRAVTCPKCENDFDAIQDATSENKPAKKKRAKRAAKLSTRSLPTPPGFGDNQAANGTHAPTDSDSNPAATPSVPEPPSPRKNRLRSPRRPTSVTESASSKKSKNRLVSPEKTETPKTTETDSVAEKQQVIARIIQSEPEEQELGKDGQLPTLQLKEDAKKKIDTGELKKRPVFLGLVICVSVLSSGLMLFFADFSPKTNQAVLDQARNDIRRFYSVRSDVELQPYQLELRAAQLAHSKNDRSGEIDAYRKVMNRFRAEDKSKFVGVTGSPGADIELEKLVSILLGDGRGSPR